MKATHKIPGRPRAKGPRVQIVHNSPDQAMHLDMPAKPRRRPPLITVSPEVARVAWEISFELLKEVVFRLLMRWSR